MIKVKKAVVCLTENELRQILSEVEKGKEETSFTNAPMANWDMSIPMWIREKRLRGTFTIESGNMAFEIKVNTGFGDNSESRGFKLNKGDE